MLYSIIAEKYILANTVIHIQYKSNEITNRYRWIQTYVIFTLLYLENINTKFNDATEPKITNYSNPIFNTETQTLICYVL